MKGAAASCAFSLAAGFSGDEQNVEETRAVDALDAGHFDVSRCRWAGDKCGGQGRGRGEAVEGLRDGFDDLFGEDYAQMIIGNERELAGALRWSILNNDRAGEGNGYRAC